MKFNIKIDTDKDNPNTIGEALRDKFWDQTEGRGCYSSFTYNFGVEKLSDKVAKYGDYDQTWHRAKWNRVICWWFWDGDGYIEFILPDGKVLINDDCKKDYIWRWKNETD